MIKYIDDLRTIIRSIREHKINMQQRLMMYFISVIVVIVGLFFVIISAAGLLSFSEKHVSQGLELSLQKTRTELNSRFDILNARGIDMSKRITSEIEYELAKNNMDFNSLNDNHDLIEELEQGLYDKLYTTLEFSDCSGVYVLLDVTANTSLENDKKMRSGLYLRRQSSASRSPASLNMALYRGCKEVAWKNKIELHNRWNMEFATDDFPDYEQLMSRNLSPAKGYTWLSKYQLPKTWENVMLLCVPVRGNNGTVYGICGIELSSLYFTKYYPSTSSEFGTITTILAPEDENGFEIAKGMYSGEQYEFGSDILSKVKGRHFNRYKSDKDCFVGVQQGVDISADDNGCKWNVAVLLPLASYKHYDTSRKITITVGMLALVAVLFLLSLMLSHKYVSPIIENIRAIQSGEFNDEQKTGYTEIDYLLSYVTELKNEQHTDSTASGREVPEGVNEIFDTFIAQVKTLTEAEYNIFRLYMEGHQIVEIPELAFISMSTVRKHNRSIYEKLGVSSRDEMMLYIDLLTKCGRIDELKRD